MQSPGAETDPGSLDRLHDIVVPDPVGWLPLAPGWIALLGIAALILCALGWRARLRYRATAYRRAALTELSMLQERAQSASDKQQIVGQLAALLKRVALAAYSRSDVASLSGDRWLEFLDKTGGTSTFRRGPGRSLCDLAYSARACEAAHATEIDALFGCARHWIRDHERELSPC